MTAGQGAHTGDWRLVPCYDLSRFRNIVNSEKTVAQNIDADDAAFIVRAVNNFDALVEALEATRRYVATCADDELPNPAADALVQIDAALSQARQG